MSARIILAPEAAEDIERALAFLAERSPSAAADLARRIVLTLEQLAAEAFEGPEAILGDGRAVRSWPVSPYRIYYRRVSGALEILRVFHQARKPIA